MGDLIDESSTTGDRTPNTTNQHFVSHLNSANIMTEENLINQIFKFDGYAKFIPIYTGENC